MRIRDVLAARSGPKQNRVRYVARSVRPEVMLPKPHSLEAQLLREDGLLSEDCPAIPWHR